MIAVGKYRIDAYRTVKVALCTSEVTEIVLCNTSKEERPVVSRVELRKHIEILYGSRILALRKCLTTAHEEYILIILSPESPPCRLDKQKNNHKKTSETNTHI